MVTRKNPSKKKSKVDVDDFPVAKFERPEPKAQAQKHSTIELQVNGRPVSFEGKLVAGAKFLDKEVAIYASGGRYVLAFIGLNLNGNRFDLLEENPADASAIGVKLSMLLSSDDGCKRDPKAAAKALDAIKKALGKA